MALLTADFPHPNSTSLAQLVLEGMGQLRNELDARTKISQNEQENWLAEGKMGASNLLMMHNVFADQRDAAAKEKQNEFNNSLNLSKFGMEQNNASYLNAYHKAEADKINWQMKQPDNPPDAPPGTILNPDGSSLLAPSAGAGGAPVVQPSPPAGMSAPNMVNGSSDQPLLGGGQVNPLLPSVSSAPAAPAQNSPLIMSQDLAAGADSAMAGSMGGAAPGMLAQADGGQTPGLLMQTPGPAAPAATPPPPPSAPAPAPSSSTPWIGKDGAIDLTKLPYNKQVQLGPGNIVSRQKLGEVDQLQYYKKVEETQPNGRKIQVTVPDGMPKVLPPESLSTEPLAVMIPQDKWQAFNYAKSFLTTVYPKLPAKEALANAQQALQMNQLMTTLANDPEVKKKLTEVGLKDFTAPPGFEVERYQFDPKDNTMVPIPKRVKPEEADAKKKNDATIKSLWEQYKNEDKVAKDDKLVLSDGSDSIQRTVARHKADALLTVIQRLSSDSLKAAVPPTPPAAAPAPVVAPVPPVVPAPTVAPTTSAKVDSIFNSLVPAK